MCLDITTRTVLHIDYASTVQGHIYALGYCHSKWLDFCVMTSSASAVTIDKL